MIRIRKISQLRHWSNKHSSKTKSEEFSKWSGNFRHDLIWVYCCSWVEINVNCMTDDEGWTLTLNSNEIYTFWYPHELQIKLVAK